MAPRPSRPSSPSSHPPPAAGRIAERLRGLDTYRAATTVFAEPVPLLHQARINLLLDGKRLVMPSPGLKQGFFLLEPFLVPFPRLPWAVSMTGAAACGRRLNVRDLAAVAISLLLCGAGEVDGEGGRAGGSGFFDLSAAILAESGSLTPDCEAWAAFSGDLAVEPLPRRQWDLPLAGVATPDELLPLCREALTPKILWDRLGDRPIRKIAPLWELCPPQRRAAILAGDDKEKDPKTAGEDKGAVKQK